MIRPLISYTTAFLTFYCVLGMKGDVGLGDRNISQSVAVYTGYVVTEHEGNKNMGQYYS